MKLLNTYVLCLVTLNRRSINELSAAMITYVRTKM
jgi:hypothetical protein